MMWTDDEEHKLLEMVRDGMTTKEIAKNLQRKYGAITSRINKINLRNV